MEASIEGNRMLSTRELGRCWSRLEGASFADARVALDVLEREVEAATEAVRAAYLDAGFAAVQQAEPRLELSADGRCLRVTFLVREGERHRIGRVRVRGPRADGPEESIPGVREGEPYCRRTLEAGLATLRARWELRSGGPVGLAVELVANPRAARLDLHVIGRPAPDALRP